MHRVGLSASAELLVRTFIQKSLETDKSGPFIDAINNLNALLTMPNKQQDVKYFVANTTLLY